MGTPKYPTGQVAQTLKFLFKLVRITSFVAPCSEQSKVQLKNRTLPFFYEHAKERLMVLLFLAFLLKDLPYPATIK